MNEQYFQLWETVPYVGRKWAWVWTSPEVAASLKLALDASPSSAAGVRWDVLTQDGQPLAVPTPPPTPAAIPAIPGLPDLQQVLAGLYIPTPGGVGFNPQPEPPARGQYIAARNPRTGELVFFRS